MQILRAILIHTYISSGVWSLQLSWTKVEQHLQSFYGCCWLFQSNKHHITYIISHKWLSVIFFGNAFVCVRVVRTIKWYEKHIISSNKYKYCPNMWQCPVFTYSFLHCSVTFLNWLSFTLVSSCSEHCSCDWYKSTANKRNIKITGRDTIQNYSTFVCGWYNSYVFVTSRRYRRVVDKTLEIQMKI